MRGKKTSDEKIEEIKALSLVYSPATISAKTGVSLRTVYEVLKRKDDLKIEALREEKRKEIVEKVWDNNEAELMKLKTKSDRLLDAINDEKIARARVSEISKSYGTLFDKRRILGDKSTSNVSVNHHHEHIIKHLTDELLSKPQDVVINDETDKNGANNDDE